MDNTFIILAVVAALAILAEIAARQKKNSQHDARHYVYRRKRFVMTKNENEFFHALQTAIGTSYVIIPQAHFDLFLDHKVEGQNWKAALSKIHRKSVDFLICNREYYSPLVAIELDDASHESAKRVERDGFESEICKEAEMPLVRFKTSMSYEPNRLLSALAPYLK